MSEQVLCINKRSRTDPHERIAHIGGGWKLTQRQAIAAIEEGPKAFYVAIGKSKTYLIFRKRLGNKYLTTEPDGTSEDNLLALGVCS
jgi:hypothetical protein